MGSNFGLSALQRRNASIERFRRQALAIKQEIRVALPGIVVAFYPDTQTVDVQIATNEYFWMTIQPDPPNPPIQNIPIQTQQVQLKPLLGIPIHIANGGGLNLTFPINAGDECIVLFTDTQLAVWFQNGKDNNNPSDQRRHNLSDGIAIFGVRSQPRVLANYSTTEAELRSDDGTVLIGVHPNGTVTVKALTVNVLSTNCTITAGLLTLQSLSTTVDGKVFLSHTHSGVQAGGSNTGPVA